MALTKIDDRGLKTPIDLLDNEKIRLGTGNDLELYHDGSTSYIKDTGTGALVLNGNEIHLNNEDNSDNCVKCIGDGAVELYHNGVKKLTTYSAGIEIHGSEGGNCELYLYADEGDDDNDNWKFTTLAASSTFQVKNRASGSWETNIECNGNGNVELYYDNSKKFETQSDGVTVTGWLYIPDSDGSNNMLRLGNGADLKIYHDGTRSYINNNAGALYLESGSTEIGLIKGTYASGEWMLRAINDGAVELYYNGSKKFETKSYGANMPDDSQLYFGSDDDAVIKHTGSHFYMTNGTGNWYIQPKANETAIEIIPDGKVGIRYDNSTKLETTSTGVTVTGSIFCGTNGTGISFESSNNNGTGGDSILFDDYEEGTFTPSVAAVSAGWDSRTGTYTKVGDLVTVFIHLNTASGGSTNGDQVAITGLPFTQVNNNGVAGVVVGYHNGLINHNYEFPFLLVSANTTTIYFHKGDGNSFTGNDVATSDFSLHVSCTYKAA